MELTDKELEAVRFAVERDVETLQEIIKSREASHQNKKELKLLLRVIEKIDDVHTT